MAAARAVLHLWESRIPGDRRPRRAIRAAEAWILDPSPRRAKRARRAREVAQGAHWDPATVDSVWPLLAVRRAAEGAAWTACGPDRFRGLLCALDSAWGAPSPFRRGPAALHPERDPR